MKNIEQEIKQSLDNLIAEDTLTKELDIITNHIRELERFLKGLVFACNENTILFEPEKGYALGYDFSSKRIMCKHDPVMVNHAEMKPLLEQKFTVRQKMFPYLSDLLNIMRKFR